MNVFIGYVSSWIMLHEFMRRMYWYHDVPCQRMIPGVPFVGEQFISDHVPKHDDFSGVFWSVEGLLLLAEQKSHMDEKHHVALTKILLLVPMFSS